MSVIDKLLGLLVPHECLGCGREGDLLCERCTKLLPPRQEVDSPILRLRSATVYGGLAKDLIWKLKSSGARAAAAPMARQMSLLVPSYTVWIVPVPTASTRARQRGYDQAEVLARQLSRLTGQPFIRCLRRLGQTHQVGASRHQRLLQLNNSFTAAKNVKNARILLIDDVVTTGATLETAAKTLLEAGAQSVEALTFAYKPKIS